MPPTRNEASAPTNPSNQRHRQRVLGALGRLCRTFEALAQRLVFRFRSDEAGDTLDAHRALLEQRGFRWREVGAWNLGRRGPAHRVALDEIELPVAAP